MKQARSQEVLHEFERKSIVPLPEPPFHTAGLEEKQN